MDGCMYLWMDVWMYGCNMYVYIHIVALDPVTASFAIL